MDEWTKTDADLLQCRYGPLYGCQLDFSAFEIQEDLGELILGGDRYAGYVINYGTGRGPHVYCMLDADQRQKATAQGDLPTDYNVIDWGPDDPEWSPAHGRLIRRLRRMSWSSFAGGENRLPPLGSPLEHYPGDGDMLCPETGNSAGTERNEEERLFIENERAWYLEVGFPDAASGYTFPSPEGEYDSVACFLRALETGKSWRIHDGPLDKIAHLYDDPTRDQFLGSLADALTIFDDFNGQDLMTRCTMTRHRASRIRLDFAGGRALTFDRLVKGCRSAGEPANHSCHQSEYQFTSDDGELTGRLRYEQLIAAIETWPLPSPA